MAAAEDGGRGDRHQAARVGVDRRQRVLGLGQFGEDVACAGQELLAGVGEHHAARASMEQARADLGLQPVDLAGDRRHGHALGLGHLRKAVGRGDGEEAVEGVDHGFCGCDMCNDALRCS